MLVSGACDWQPTSGNWPCAWRPSDYYRFLLSDSRNRFLSTDLQSAFWKLFGKEPSLGFPMDLTNLHALPNDQKAASRSELTSHQLAFRPLHTRQQHLTDGLGRHYTSKQRMHPVGNVPARCQSNVRKIGRKDYSAPPVALSCSAGSGPRPSANAFSAARVFASMPSNP